LGDFEEKYATIWLPKFGPKFGTAVYIVQAFHVMLRLAGAATIAGLAAKVFHAFGKG
jgi:hypothetical protein